MTTYDLHFGSGMIGGDGETASQARWLEELGFEYVSSGEHYMRGNPPSATSVSLPVLAVAAGATERIRLVSSVLLVPFYHPTVLAKLTATLDIASNGRLTLGIGVGGEFPVEFEAAGLNVKQRGRRTNECLDVLRRLWTEEHVSYQGRHFELNDVTINPHPNQKPHPPIWVAGRRDAAMKRAALYCDGWYPYFYSPEQYRESVEKITGFAKEIDRDISGFQWAYYPFISIYPTVEEAATIAAKALGRYSSQGDFLEVVKRYCIIGPVDACVSRLKEYVDAGARHIVFSVSCPAEDRKRHIETIVQEIIPGLKSAVEGLS